MGRLRDRMRDDLRLRNYSERTIYGYLLYARRSVAHFMKPPEQITRDKVRAYLLHLMNERGLAASTYRQHRAAITILYEVTLSSALQGRADTPPEAREAPAGGARPRRGSRAPEVGRLAQAPRDSHRRVRGRPGSRQRIR